MMSQHEAIEANTNGGRKVHLPDDAKLTETFRQIVQRHCACYEVSPEWSATGGRVIRVGFSISLCGVPENGAGVPDVPGSRDCWTTYSALRRVAESILPKEERSCHFELGAFDRAWHIAPSVRHGRRETVVTIGIYHRRNFHTPVDDCQHQCLNEMRASLAYLAMSENTLPPGSRK